MTNEQELELTLEKFEKTCKIRDQIDRMNALTMTKDYIMYHGQELCRHIGGIQTKYQLECIGASISVLKEILEALESRKEQLL